jgi:hypothetical protein
MAANYDKSKPFFPLASQANDGYSHEHEATATCFCGAVQLEFVSVSSSNTPLPPLIPSLANRSPWPNRQLRLQLRRLPQNHRLHVRI